MDVSLPRPTSECLQRGHCGGDLGDGGELLGDRKLGAAGPVVEAGRNSWTEHLG